MLTKREKATANRGLDRLMCSKIAKTDKDAAAALRLMRREASAEAPTAEVKKREKAVVSES